MAVYVWKWGRPKAYGCSQLQLESNMNCWMLGVPTSPKLFGLPYRQTSGFRPEMTRHLVHLYPAEPYPYGPNRFCASAAAAKRVGFIHKSWDDVTSWIVSEFASCIIVGHYKLWLYVVIWQLPIDHWWLLFSQVRMLMIQRKPVLSPHGHVDALPPWPWTSRSCWCLSDHRSARSRKHGASRSTRSLSVGRTACSMKFKLLRLNLQIATLPSGSSQKLDNPEFFKFICCC